MKPADYATDNATTGSRSDEHPCWSTVLRRYVHVPDLWSAPDVCVDCGSPVAEDA